MVSKMNEVKLDMDTILKLLRNERSITFVSKWYNGTTDNLQINNDNTFQTNETSNTRCVVARGLTKKRLNDMRDWLKSIGYTELEPIKY